MSNDVRDFEEQNSLASKKLRERHAQFFRQIAADIEAGLAVSYSFHIGASEKFKVVGQSYAGFPAYEVSVSVSAT